MVILRTGCLRRRATRTREAVRHARRGNLHDRTRRDTDTACDKARRSPGSSRPEASSTACSRAASERNCVDTSLLVSLAAVLVERGLRGNTHARVVEPSDHAIAFDAMTLGADPNPARGAREIDRVASDHESTESQSMACVITCLGSGAGLPPLHRVGRRLLRARRGTARRASRRSLRALR
jgi:hypothetical protein